MAYQTLYRKYRVGTIISAQNLSQFGAGESTLKQTLLANCTTKIVFGNNTPEDNDWWEKELGEKREWQATRDYEPQGLLQNTETVRKKVETLSPTGPEYTSTLKSIKYAWTKNYAAGKVQSLKFKQILYKTKDMKGKNIVGKAKVDFLEESYKDEKTPKTYNFAKFSNGILESNSDVVKTFIHCS